MGSKQLQGPLVSNQCNGNELFFFFVAQMDFFFDTFSMKCFGISIFQPLVIWQYFTSWFQLFLIFTPTWGRFPF